MIHVVGKTIDDLEDTDLRKLITMRFNSERSLFEDSELCRDLEILIRKFRCNIQERANAVGLNFPPTEEDADDMSMYSREPGIQFVEE